MKVPFVVLSKLYFTFFLIAGNAVFDDGFHAVFFQAGGILLVFNLCKCFITAAFLSGNALQKVEMVSLLALDVSLNQMRI